MNSTNNITEKKKRPFGILLIIIVEFMVLLPAIVQVVNFNAPAVLMGLNVLNIFVGIFNLILTSVFLYCLFKNSYLYIMQTILGLEALNKITYWLVLANRPIEELLQMGNVPTTPELLTKAPLIKGLIFFVGLFALLPQGLFSLYLWYQRDFFKKKTN